jgi:predicted phosphodiesterase
MPLHPIVGWTARTGVLIMCVAAGALGCARPALVTETFPAEFHEIPPALETGQYPDNPRMIVIGDTRPGWRLEERFTRREAWATWWQLAIPFYQLYWIGNGIVGGINGLRWMPDYGDDDARRVRDDAYTRAGDIDADFFVHLGDIATDGRRAVLWRNFLTIYKEESRVLSEYPLLAIAGNHERATDPTYGGPNYEAVFGRSSFYTVSCPDVDLFFIDSDFIVDQYGFIADAKQDSLFDSWFVAPDGAEPAWLQRELAASEKTFRVVFMHHPPLSFAKHNRNWTDPNNGNRLREKRRRLLKLFHQYGVQLVVTGHQHMYEHNVLTSIGGEAVEPLHVIITGGGGSPLHRASTASGRDEYRMGYRNEGLEVACKVQESVYNYCVLEVDDERLTITAYEVTKDPEETGRQIERVTIERTE